MSEEKASRNRFLTDSGKLLLSALAFACVSVLVTGYKVYFHNQALQIPLVRLLNDPSLYPHDPFAATLPYYASGVWRLVAWCARVARLEPLLLALFLAERFIVMYAAGNLALALAPKSRLAMVGAMAFFATDPMPIIGGGTILMPYFEQTSLAVGLIMMAMAAFYRRRPVAWAMWLAAAFNCNSMYGCYALSYFGIAFLLSADYRQEWKAWMRSLALFAVLSTPSLVLSAGVVGQGHVNAHLWLEASRARVPHHIFPSTWPWVKFARFALLVLAALYAAALIRRQGNRHSGASLLIWTAVSLGWVMIAVAAERLHSPMMLMLQPARATDLWYAFAATALIAGWAVSPRRLDLLGLAMMPFALFHPDSAIGLVLLAAIGVVLAKQWVGHGKLAYAVAGLVAVVGIGTLASRVVDHAPALVAKPSRSMCKVCNWARESTPKDAAFLVNPNWGEFRGLSERPAFVTWKDGSGLLWDRPFAAPWAERIHALGYDVTTGKLPGDEVNKDLNQLYDSLTDARANQLAVQYGLRYWVVRTDHKSELPVSYSSHYFKVLRLTRGVITARNAG